jgi:cytochrome P450
MEAGPVDLGDENFVTGVPHEALRYLRTHEPVWWWPGGECWVVTSYERIVEMNRDFNTYSSAGGVVPPGVGMNPSVLLAMDPPLHTEYRRMVIRSFVPRAIAALEASVRSIAAEAVAAFVAQGGGDFVEVVASAIPYRVMADLTGLPRSDEKVVTRWGNAIGPSSDPEFRPTPSAMADAQAEISEYLGAQFEARRHDPGSDLFSDLLKVEYEGRPLSEEDLRGFGINYILGGTETTRNLVAQGMLALLEHPEQATRYATGEVTGDTLVEEILRFSTPVMHHSRWATETRTVEGRTIKAGDRVTLWMISANRDDSVFDDPDGFDAGRQPNAHIALGSGGPHFCLGAHLARLEATAAFDALRPYLPRVALAASPERVRSNFFNGLKHLQLSLD